VNWAFEPFHYHCYCNFTSSTMAWRAMQLLRHMKTAWFRLIFRYNISHTDSKCVNMFHSGFPHSIESIEKVLNCDICFQDFEIVLTLAEMYTKYWKSMEILNWTICLLKFVLYCWWKFCRCFMHCVPWIKFWKNLDK